MKVKHLLHCHLMVPVARLRMSAAEQPLPAFKQLLNWSESSSVAEDGVDAWLCRRFGITQQQDWPTAALAALGDGLDVGDYYWLHADPAYVHLLRDRIILTDEAFEDLFADEAVAIVDTLNQHFNEQAMRFIATGTRWYLRLQLPAGVSTRSRHQAVNGDIQQNLPTGPESMRWHCFLNEVQMLLHEHPVNQAREQRDGLPVNSLWLSGGGVLPTVSASPFSGIWANDALMVGLATASGCPGFPAPDSVDEWLAQQQSGPALVVPDRIVNLERGWFAPLAHALKSGRLQSLTLHLMDAHRVQSLFIPRTQCWKFWRRSHPLDFAIHG